MNELERIEYLRRCEKTYISAKNTAVLGVEMLISENKISGEFNIDQCLELLASIDMAQKKSKEFKVRHLDEVAKLIQTKKYEK